MRVCTYIYIYTYIYRERDREREIHTCIDICTCVYIYIYIYIVDYNCLICILCSMLDVMLRYVLCYMLHCVIVHYMMVCYNRI